MVKKTMFYIKEIMKLFPIAIIISYLSSNSMVSIGVVIAVGTLLNVFYIADACFCFKNKACSKKLLSFIFNIAFVVLNFIPLIISLIFVISSLIIGSAQLFVLVGSSIISLIVIVMYIILLVMRKSFADKDQISFKTNVFEKILFIISLGSLLALFMYDIARYNTLIDKQYIINKVNICYQLLITVVLIVSIFKAKKCNSILNILSIVIVFLSGVGQIVLAFSNQFHYCGISNPFNPTLVKILYILVFGNVFICPFALLFNSFKTSK